MQYDKQYEVAQLISRLLCLIEDTGDLREGVKKTPGRVAKAYTEWFAGYGVDPSTVLTALPDDEGEGELFAGGAVVIRGIPFASFCEHHMAPFSGTVSIVYQCAGSIVGLSKVPRLVEVLSTRLQLQERLTRQIAQYVQAGLCGEDVEGTVTVQEAVNHGVLPDRYRGGVLVQIVSEHSCMTTRGIKSHGSNTKTIYGTGVYSEKHIIKRQEGLRLINE